MTYEEKLKYTIEEQKTMRKIETNWYVSYIRMLKKEKWLNNITDIIKHTVSFE